MIATHTEFDNPDTLTALDIEPAKAGATIYLHYLDEDYRPALAISLQEFDAVAREVARWRALQTQGDV